MLNARTEDLYTFISDDSGDEYRLKTMDKPEKIITICVGA